MRFDLHPFDGVDEARQWARDQIDKAAGMARARFITLTPGQDTTYQVKYAEAQAFADSGAADDAGAFPWIAAEAQHAGVSLTAAAARIKRKGDEWNKIYGPRIEAIRVAAKDQLAGFAEVGQVVKVARAAVAALQEVREKGE
jgi:hypothetical protein